MLNKETVIMERQRRADTCEPSMGMSMREMTISETLMQRADNLRAEAHRMESLARELNMQALSPGCTAHLGNLIRSGMRGY